MLTDIVVSWSDAPFNQKLWTVVAGLCFLMVVITIAALLRQRRVLRKGAVTPELFAQDERTALIEAIKDAATEPNMRIALRGFWRGRGWNRRQRYALLRPLMDRKILHLPPTSDGWSKFIQDAKYHSSACRRAKSC